MIQDYVCEHSTAGNAGNGSSSDERRRGLGAGPGLRRPWLADGGLGACELNTFAPPGPSPFLSVDSALAMKFSALSFLSVFVAGVSAQLSFNSPSVFLIPHLSPFSIICTEGTCFSVHLLPSCGLVALVRSFSFDLLHINSHYPIAPYFLVRIALSTVIAIFLHSPVLT